MQSRFQPTILRLLQPGLWLALLAAPLAYSPVAEAAPPAIVAQEEREFEILIDGKPCGSSLMLITDYADGQSSAVTAGNVSLNLVIFTFTYELRSSEVWYRGKMLRTETEVVNNGSKSKVTMIAEKEQSKITKDGKKPMVAPLFSFSNNYWHLPPAEVISKKTKVLEAETGESKTCILESGEAAALTVQGQKLACRLYQLRGDLSVDFAFDEVGRLAYQKTKKLGKVTELRLKRIQPVELAAVKRETR